MIGLVIWCTGSVIALMLWLIQGELADIAKTLHEIRDKRI